MVHQSIVQVVIASERSGVSIPLIHAHYSRHTSSDDRPRHMMKATTTNTSSSSSNRNTRLSRFAVIEAAAQVEVVERATCERRPLTGLSTTIYKKQKNSILPSHFNNLLSDDGEYPRTPHEHPNGRNYWFRSIRLSNIRAIVSISNLLDGRCLT